MTLPAFVTRMLQTADKFKVLFSTTASSSLTVCLIIFERGLSFYDNFLYIFIRTFPFKFISGDKSDTLPIDYLHPQLEVCWKPTTAVMPHLHCASTRLCTRSVSVA